MNENILDDQSPQKAGDIRIDEIVLIDRHNTELDIRALLIELNIFEDVFSNCLYGNVVLSDGQSILEKLPIVGEEYIRISCRTPGFEDPDTINKTFRIYSVGDRQIVNSDRTQQYTLHFCSSEAIVDVLSPLSKTFTGRADQVVADIFNEFIRMPRNIVAKDGDVATDSDTFTDIAIFDETKNNITFTSPKWTPLECINWVGSRSVPKNTLGSSYLLFETNKQFIFATIEQLIEAQLNNNMVAEHYVYRPSNIKTGMNIRDTSYNYKIQNIPEDYRIVESMYIDNNFNSLQNLQNGYYASKLFKFDVIKKDYTTHDFDYVAQFDDYKHIETIENGQGGPFFLRNTVRNTDAKTIFYPSHPNLYMDKKDNASEIIEQTMQNRMSLLNDLNNYRITVTVNGRTDMEAGNIVKFDFPSVSPKDETTTQETAVDKYLGGLYLVTAIRHKINLAKHMMTMELIKDSVSTSLETS